MGIEIRQHEGDTYPCFVCDGCGEQITEGEGILAWQLDADYKATGHFLTFHKTHDRGSPARDWPWVELDVWLGQLMHNTGTTPDTVHRRFEQQQQLNI